MIDRLATMRQLAAKQPSNPLARFGLANELVKAGLQEEAAVELAAYLSQHDDEGNGWLRYADVLRSLERNAEAQTAIRRGIASARRFGHATLVNDLEALSDAIADS